MKTILHRRRLIEIVVNPLDALHDLSSAQSIAVALSEIEMKGKVYPLDSEFYVTADTLGVTGDVVKSIRQASSEELRQAKESGQFYEYVQLRNEAERELIERQIEEIKSWMNQHRETVKTVPHTHPPDGMRGKTIFEQLHAVDSIFGPHERLREYRRAKNVVLAYFPHLIRFKKVTQ